MARVQNRPAGGISPAATLLSMALAGLLIGLTPADIQAQKLSYNRGQPVFPAYEGWRENPDGTFSLLFGYMNENWEQSPDIPIGENNFFSPGPPDQGQPTYFMPRRNRFIFEVRVPPDFGEANEMVWTLSANGQEYKAFGTLKPDYYIDNVVIMSETGALGAGTSSPEIRANIAPVVELEGARFRRARVGEPVRLVANVVDDGVPEAKLWGSRAGVPLKADMTPRELLERALDPPGGSTVNKVVGLHFGWFPYRRTGEVEIDPPQIKPWEDTRPSANSPWSSLWVPPSMRNPPELPEDGRWVAEATFSEPGTYVLHGRADDGGLYTDVEVTVEVTP